MNRKYSFIELSHFGDCLLQQFAYPDCEVGLFVREYSFPSLSHHGWNILPYSINDEFGQWDVNRHAMTWHAFIPASKLPHSFVLQLSCCFAIPWEEQAPARSWSRRWDAWGADMAPTSSWQPRPAYPNPGADEWARVNDYCFKLSFAVVCYTAWHGNSWLIH